MTEAPPSAQLDNDKATEVDPADRLTTLAVRGVIAGAGLLGLTLYVKNSRLFARFQHVKRIPKEYYQNEVQLRGIVREITPSGLLKVEHQPLVSVARLLGRKAPRKGGLLNLRLAGVNLSDEGLAYLAKDMRLSNRPILFEVVKPSDNNTDAADAVVTNKKGFFTTSNVNVDLIRKGLARVRGPEDGDHLKALQDYSVYSRLVSRLLTCEKVADRRGVGVWERSTWVESVQSLPVSFVEVVKVSAVTKLVILCFNILRDLVIVAINVVKQGYHLTVTVAGYTSNAYRSFADTVDRMTKFYAAQKSRLRIGGGGGGGKSPGSGVGESKQ